MRKGETGIEFRSSCIRMFDLPRWLWMGALTESPSDVRALNCTCPHTHFSDIHARGKPLYSGVVREVLGHLVSVCLGRLFEKLFICTAAAIRLCQQRAHVVSCEGSTSSHPPQRPRRLLLHWGMLCPNELEVLVVGVMRPSSSWLEVVDTLRTSGIAAGHGRRRGVGEPCWRCSDAAAASSSMGEVTLDMSVGSRGGAAYRWPWLQLE